VFQRDNIGEGRQMSTTVTMRNRLKLNRPSLRKNARPPKLRTHLGQAFTAANLSATLVMQHCQACNSVQYPPRELCQHCLEDSLVWRETNTRGHIINRVAVHNSLWEYFKRRIKDAPWPIATVRLDCNATVFAHLALHSFDSPTIGDIAAATPVEVFSHTDASQSSVLIAVAAGTTISRSEQRREIIAEMGLLQTADKVGGI
jgi:uncharacterized OB-fold protein